MILKFCTLGKAIVLPVFVLIFNKLSGRNIFFHCAQMVKIVSCTRFPEFIMLSLDMELHSFSIYLRIPNHNIQDKNMLPINIRKLQMENKRAFVLILSALNMKY